MTLDEFKTYIENTKERIRQLREFLKIEEREAEILEIQEKIRQLESEIESRKGRLKYLDHQVGFSTINLTITQHHPRSVEPNKNFGHELVNSFKKGINGFLSFTLTLVRYWPFILIFFILWIFRKKINLKFWKRTKE